MPNVVGGQVAAKNEPGLANIFYHIYGRDISAFVSLILKLNGRKRVEAKV